MAESGMFLILVVVAGVHASSTPGLEHIPAPSFSACKQMAELLNDIYRRTPDISASARCLALENEYRSSQKSPANSMADVLARPLPPSQGYGPTGE